MISYSPKIVFKIFKYSHQTIEGLVNVTKTARCYNLDLVGIQNDFRDFLLTNPSKKEIQEQKREMPYVTPSGIFKSRADIELINENGFAFGDVDKITSEENYETIKNVLIANPHVFFIKRSISGRGIHFLFRYEKLESGSIQDKILHYKKAIYTFYDKIVTEVAHLAEIDYSISNISRAMILSHDPDCFYRDYKNVEELLPLDIKEEETKFIKKNTEHGVIDVAEVNHFTVNSDDIQEIFSAALEHVAEKYNYTWREGQRRSFILKLVGTLRNYHLSSCEISSMLLNHVNGDYTSEYNSVTLPQIVQNLVNDVKHLPEELQKSSISSNVVTYTKYISEKVEEIATLINPHKYNLLVSETGSGKTSIIPQLFPTQYVDIIMPTTALVDQQNFRKNHGSFNMTHDDLTSQYFCTTWANISKLEYRCAEILVVDESHGLVCDNSWKYQTIQDIQCYMKQYKKVIFLTGTPQPLEHLNWNRITCRKNSAKREYEFLITNQRDTDEFLNAVRTDGKQHRMVFYKNDIQDLEILSNILTKDGYKVALITSLRKNEEEYLNIVNEQLLGDYDVLLSTAVIQAGVNILDSADTKIYFEKKSNVIDIIQFTARFRNTYPKIYIFSNGNYHATYNVKWQIEQLLKTFSDDADRLSKGEIVLSKMKQKIEVDDFNYNMFFEKLTTRYDGLYKQNEKWYIDEFYFNSERFKFIISNCSANINYFTQYLHLADYICIGKRYLNNEDADFGKAKRDIKAFVKMTNEEFSNYVITTTDSITTLSDYKPVQKEIIQRYRKLKSYGYQVKIEDISTKAGYEKMYMRLKILKNEYSLKNTSIVSTTQDYVDNQHYMYLKKLLNVGEYTSNDLRVLLDRAGFKNTSITSVIELVWHIEGDKVKKIDGKAVRVYNLIKPIKADDYNIHFTETSGLF